LLVAAVADVHSPRYLDEFSTSLSRCKVPDLFLFAGDMIGSRSADEYSGVVDAIESQLGTAVPIVACRGNEERRHMRGDVADSADGRVRFIDDEALRFDAGRTRLGIVGVSTMIAEHAASETTDIGSIGAAFERRIEKLSKLLGDLSKASTYTILLMHYSPLAGDSPVWKPGNTFSWWVSKCTEKTRPDLVLHGHVHTADRLETTVGGTRVINVAFPASGKVTVLEL